MGSAGDEGYFPPGRSILRHVHSQRAVGLLFGQRALMIGALNPLNFVGTVEHTRGRTTPFARLAHTGQAFEAIFFGSRADADRVLESVHGLHGRVRGQLCEDAGIYPAGTPYAAFDARLMLWTVAVIADSAIVFYDLLVGRLGAGERDALWREYVRFGELFGMPRAAAPASYRDFRDYWRRTLAGDEMHLTETAREVGNRVRDPAAEHLRAREASPRPGHARQPAAEGPRAVRIAMDAGARGSVPDRGYGDAALPPTRPAPHPRGSQRRGLRSRRPHRASPDRTRRAHAAGRALSFWSAEAVADVGRVACAAL